MEKKQIYAGALYYVEITTFSVATSGMFDKPFNQITFLNYDTFFPVTVLDNIVIPVATVAGPSQFRINLNTGEVCQTNIRYNSIGGQVGTMNLVIIYSQYKELLK